MLFHLVLVLALKLSGSQTGQLEGNTGSFLSRRQRFLGLPKGDDSEPLELERCRCVTPSCAAEPAQPHCAEASGRQRFPCHPRGFLYLQSLEKQWKGTEQKPSWWEQPCACPQAAAHLGCSCTCPPHRTSAGLQHTRLPRSRTWDVGVTEAARDPPLVHLQLQCIDFIYITRDSADRAQQRALESEQGNVPGVAAGHRQTMALKLLLGPGGEGSRHQQQLQEQLLRA